MSECFDCKRFHHECEADCCRTFPLPIEIWDRNQDKIVQEMVGTIVIPILHNIRLITPTTKSGMCPFLKEDLTCNIYEDRPEPCVVFGTEKPRYMSCAFQDKEGKKRSRQSHRKIKRQNKKMVDSRGRKIDLKLLESFIEENFKKW